MAPLKGAGKGAKKGLEGVSTPKRARGAPGELPLIRSQEGSEEDPHSRKARRALRGRSPLLRELEELQGSLRSKKARMASK